MPEPYRAVVPVRHGAHPTSDDVVQAGEGAVTA